MFARFKNLFTKNKNETEANADAETLSCALLEESVYGESLSTDNVNVEPSKLEGLNLLKSIVENEQNVSKRETKVTTSLSQEVEDLLKKRLSTDEENTDVNGLNATTDGESKNLKEASPSKELLDSKENPNTEKISNENEQQNLNLLQRSLETAYADKTLSNLITRDNKLFNTDNPNTVELAVKETEHQQISISELIGSIDSKETATKNVKDFSENSNEKAKQFTDPEIIIQNSNQNLSNSDVSHTNEKQTILSESNEINSDSQVTDYQIPTSHENSSDCTDSSKSLSQSSIKDSLKETKLQNSSFSLETNILPINSSIVVEDINTEITAPSPTVDSTISTGSSSNTSILDSSGGHDTIDGSKIIVNPIDNNGLACSAITNKLTDIAEVAETLDAVIREVQENVQSAELESNPSPSDKKLSTLRSTSSEDWHSRSTEDDSFATASEGNFTPHSHSSASFQTASGRTSSFRSCDKNSFDASEADDSTFAFEMPELTSPLNMSFEGSEQSYVSAQPTNGEQTYEDKEKTPTKLSDCSSQTVNALEEDQSSIADIEDLHSESVTPTPADTIEEYHGESIPIESETELEIAGISDAPTLEILTEHSAMPMSKTPEVSPTTTSSIACTNRNSNSHLALNEATDLNDPQLQNTNNNNNSNTNKPNAAWRRSKYYENITKQTIKGFL